MAEIALAAVSFSFQVFSGCIQGYQLLSEALGLPEEYQYVRVRIKNEQFRLLDWACVVRVSESDSSLVVGRAGKAMVLDILEQQHNLLHRFGRFDERLKPVSKPLLSDVPFQAERAITDTVDENDRLVKFPKSAELYQRALKYIRSTRTLPTRLRWIACDKTKIETLLVKITSLNDTLTELLNKDQLDKLLELQVRTHYGIMQLNSSVDQLVSIIRAEKVVCLSNPAGTVYKDGVNGQPSDFSTTPGDSPPPDVTSTPETHTELSSLAQVKALNLIIHQGNLNTFNAQRLGLMDASNSGSPELCKDDFCFLEAIPSMEAVLENPRTEAIYYHSKSRRTGTQVWIEWKHEEHERSVQATRAPPQNDSHDMAKNERLSALVSLLRHDKNTQLFRAAQCLGYIREEVVIPDSRKLAVHYRYGLAFAKPSYSDPSTSPRPLLHILQDQKQMGATHGFREDELFSGSPSLTQRFALAVALAESMERLHAVNWLHKGFRSSNILFFNNSVDKTPCGGQLREWKGLALDQPIISGFEYARPADQPLWTEMSHSPIHDLYRHPEVQADSGRNSLEERTEMFKKTYDIYALGIVLLEIAFWTPIHVILGVDMENCALKDTMIARRRLMNEPRFLQGVRSSMGDIMCDVIRACLAGFESSGPADLDDHGGSDRGLKLQEEFYVKVVRKLKSVCI